MGHKFAASASAFWAAVHLPSSLDLKQRLYRSTKYYPLVAAIWAPLSTLLDIPALTEAWFDHDGAPVADPSASVVLSICGLAVNVIANALLVARFSTDKRWRQATLLSVVCWIIKFVLAWVNALHFGTRRHHNSGITYSEGFWCAILSLIITGFINILLIVHCATHHQQYFHYRNKAAQETNEHRAIRVQGKSFMLTKVVIFSLFGIQALIFSRVEHWTYLQGIYFSLVTGFTIGFGDFYPTHNITRTLNFFFAVATIALLAVDVGIILDYIRSHASRRKARWRARFEQEYKESKAKERRQKLACGERALGNHVDYDITLVDELYHLQEMINHEEWYWRTLDLCVSLLVLTLFWMAGAAIFCAIEGYSFGSSVYFCYVFFLTIGYGSDFAPVTPAGRVVFLVFALMAVPVVTSFVVQTVTSLIEALAKRQVDKDQDRRAPSKTEQEPFHSHAWYINHTHTVLSGQKISPSPHAPGDNKKEANLDKPAVESPENKAGDASVSSNENEKRSESATAAFEHNPVIASLDDKLLLTRVVLQLAIKLEDQARSLIIDNLEQGSRAQLLLQADNNLHERAIRHHVKTQQQQEKQKQQANSEPAEEQYQRIINRLLGEDHHTNQPLTTNTPQLPADTLGEVSRFRKTFASMLVVGAKLLELEGAEKLMFERMLPLDHQSSQEQEHKPQQQQKQQQQEVMEKVMKEEGDDVGDGIMLGSGRRGFAEKMLNVDV